MPNRHFLVKFLKCQKIVYILSHEAKALLEPFCLQSIIFGWRQNSSSNSFASSGKTKTHDFTLADHDRIVLMIFKICGSGLDRIQFHRIRTGLGLKNFTVCSSLQNTSDDHYPLCRLDIREDTEFATRYLYQKNASKRELDTDLSENIFSIFRGFRLLEKVA